MPTTSAPRHRARPAALLALLCCTLPAFAQFGPNRDDPRIADPAVSRPAGRACTVEVVNHGFANFDPYIDGIAPPAACPGPWSKIVLDLDGQVAGVQFDRIGHFEVGGVTVFRFSTPEPSANGTRGILWHVEKDLTPYTDLFRRPQETRMYLGNVVNETYTGVINVKTTITFYQADARDRAPETPQIVSPADQQRVGSDLVGTFTLPANTERLVAEVYATGSGGGCEEFWYLNAPVGTAYSCPASGGPYREVQVLVDGRVAGIAMPYPHIYTGGWSNPFLWYTIPAPRAFNIRPIQYDLTPFVGLLNDGARHEVRFRVAGLAADASGWSLQPNLQVWRDAGVASTRGGLLEYGLSDPTYTHTPGSGDGYTHANVLGAHALRARGWLQTSRGRVETLVERRVANDSRHRWDEGEYHDGLVSAWHDTQTVTELRRGHVPSVRLQQLDYRVDGLISVEEIAGGALRIVTDMDIRDLASFALAGPGGVDAWHRRNTFEGSAGWNYGVPREQRNGSGHSRQRYVQAGLRGECYDREIASANGFFTSDTTRCNRRVAP